MERMAQDPPWCQQSSSRAVPCPVSLCSVPFLQGNTCGCLQPRALLLWELSTVRCTGKSPNLLPAKLCAYLQTKKAMLGSCLFYFFFFYPFSFRTLVIYEFTELQFFFLHLPPLLALSVSQLLLKGGDLS